MTAAQKMILIVQICTFYGSLTKHWKTNLGNKRNKGGEDRGAVTRRFVTGPHWTPSFLINESGFYWLVQGFIIHSFPEKTDRLYDIEIPN